MLAQNDAKVNYHPGQRVRIHPNTPEGNLSWMGLTLKPGDTVVLEEASDIWEGAWWFNGHKYQIDSADFGPAEMLTLDLETGEFALEET